jgi:phosphonate transport system substrate-binding protein
MSKVVLAVVLLTLSASVSAETRLTFGLYTSDKASAMVRQFRPLLDVLEQKVSATLGEEVRISMKIAGNYQEGRDNLVEGKVDFSRFGSASYVLAKERDPGISILAVETKKGAKVFNGVMAVKADSPIQDLKAAKGKRFGFGSETSTIGRYLAQYHLLQNDIKSSDLAAFEYLGRHDTVGAMVAIGKFDVGALKESTFKKLVKKGKPLRAIMTFPVPTKPWLARSGLDEAMKQALSQALLSIDDPEALEALKKDRLVAGSDEDYATIRAAMQRNDEFHR